MTRPLAFELPGGAPWVRRWWVALLLFCLTGLLAGCGGSSRAISIIGPPELLSIAVTPADSSLATAATLQFTATGSYSDGSKQDLTAAVTWSSAVASVATVSNVVGSAGLATGISAGGTTITASVGALSGSTTLTVTGATLLSIGVTPAASAIAHGTAAQFAATGVYSDSSTQDLTAVVTWATSSPAVATITAGGLAKGVAAGTTAVTATLGLVVGTTTLTVTSANLVSIAVTPANANLPTGTTQPYTATGLFSDNSTQNLTTQVGWTSSAPTLASVSNAAGSQGVVTGLAAGTSTLTAAFGAITGSTAVNVTASTLVSIAIAPQNTTVAKGSTVQFIATGTYGNGQTQVLTTSVTWSSSGPTVANISNVANSQGLAHALGAGTSTITATLGGVTATASLTVTDATLVSIVITPAGPSIARNSHLQFTAIGTFTDNTTQNLTAAATWSSNSPTVATISNAAGSQGLATTINPGTSTLTASVGNVTGTTTLTVTSTTTATLLSILVTPVTASIPKGDTQAYTAVGTYADGSTQVITGAVSWTAGTPATATITNAGVATGAGVGSTTITATDPTTGIVSNSANLTVTAAALVSIAVTPATATVSIGQTQQYVATGSYTDGTQGNLTTAVTWNSGTPAIGIITPGPNGGLATGVAVGITQIGASLGGITSPTVPLTVAGAFAYVVNYDQGVGTPSTLSLYSIAANGDLIAQATPTVAAGLNPFALTIDPTGKYLYVVNYVDPGYTALGSISQYAINADGSLTPLVPATVASGFGPNGIVANPNPAVKVLYVANYNAQEISEYSIGAGGTLTPLGTATANGLNPAALALNPAGTFAYAANFNSTGSIDQYRVVNGLLEAIPLAPATVAADCEPNDIVVDPSGKYVYTANFGGIAPCTTGDDISQYSIDQTTGALTPLTPANVAAQAGTSSITLDAAGANAYVTNRTAGTVQQFKVGAGGGLTLYATVAVPNAAGPNWLAIDPSGRFAYVTNRSVGSTRVSEFTISPVDGSLTALGAATAGPTPTAVITHR